MSYRQGMHICNVCSKVFARKDSLVRHTKIHNPDPSLKCHICEASFAAPSSLKRHMTTKHKECMRCSQLQREIEILKKENEVLRLKLASRCLFDVAAADAVIADDDASIGDNVGDGSEVGINTKDVNTEADDNDGDGDETDTGTAGDVDEVSIGDNVANANIDDIGDTNGHTSGLKRKVSQKLYIH